MPNTIEVGTPRLSRGEVRKKGLVPKEKVCQ